MSASIDTVEVRPGQDPAIVPLFDAMNLADEIINGVANELDKKELSTRVLRWSQIYAQGLTDAQRVTSADYVKQKIKDIPYDLRAKVEFYFFGQVSPENAADPLAALAAEFGVKMYTTWADAALMLGEMTWAWQDWLPNGLLTMLGGEQGSGKSILALRIASSFITGQPWPNGTPYAGELGKVLWCETESGQGLNTERARAWGLPLDCIITPHDDPLADIALDNPEDQLVISNKAALPEVRFVVVDSLSGGSLRRDENSAGAMAVTKWLAELGKSLKKPLLAVHHLRKKNLLDPGDVVTLDMFRGSSAITQTARVVWTIDQPDRESETRRLSICKYNLGRRPDALGMTISDTGITFDADAPEAPHEETQSDKARDLLLALLDAGPMKYTDLEQEVKGAGISIPTLNRVKKSMGIVARKDGKGWSWGLPARDTE